METQTFSALICRTQAAPLTRRLLGNSSTSNNKLFYKKCIVEQTNFLSLGVLGLKALSEKLSEVSIQNEVQQKKSQNQSLATPEYLLRHLKEDDMKIALLFKLKNEELKQFQNGDTTVIRTCLKSLAEGAILSDDKQLCAFLEKIRQTNDEENIIKAECVAKKKHRNVLTQYQEPSFMSEESNIGDLAKPIKYFSGRKPIFCDKSTQYERLNGCSDGSETNYQINVTKKLSNKLIQCDRLENGLKTLHKTLSYELDMLSKATQCQQAQYICESLANPIMNMLSNKADNIVNDFPLEKVHTTSQPMPEDSLIIIRKKFMEKQNAIQPEEFLFNPQPIYNSFLTVQHLDKDMEWLEEETEPEFYSSTEVDNDSLLALDTPNNANDFNKYNKQYTENYYNNYDTGNNAKEHSNTSFEHKDAEFFNTNSSDFSSQSQAQDQDQDKDSYEDPKQNNFVSIDAESAFSSPPMKKLKFDFRTNTKIPIRSSEITYFKLLLKRLSISKMRAGSLENKFFKITGINNATIQLEAKEGNKPSADTLYDCQKLSSKEPMELFEQNHQNSKLEKPGTLAELQGKQKIGKSLITPKKQSKIAAKIEKIERNLAELKQRNRIETEIMERPTISNEVMATKTTLTSQRSKKKLSYDKKQRQLVELIARGVEHEMLSNSEKNNA